MNAIVCKGQLDWINVYNSITSSFAAAIVSNGFISSADTNVHAADFSILHIPIFLKKSYITTILEWINFHICHLQKSLQKDPHHHFSTVHKNTCKILHFTPLSNVVEDLYQICPPWLEYQWAWCREATAWWWTLNNDWDIKWPNRVRKATQWWVDSPLPLLNILLYRICIFLLNSTVCAGNSKVFQFPGMQNQNSFSNLIWLQVWMTVMVVCLCVTVHVIPSSMLG